MSGIAGVFTFDGDGRASVAGAVDALTSLDLGVARWGLDAHGRALMGPVGMAFRGFHVDARARRERQPYRRGDCLLAWDGRLDNRSELASLLDDDVDLERVVVREDRRGTTGRVDRRDRDAARESGATDAALVIAAWRRWDTEAIGRLVGDFALALWDGATRTLTLARDFVGARPLYYHVDRRRLLCASDLGALLEAARVPIEISDDFIADFLLRNPSVVRTPYVGFHAVKPGHLLTIDARGNMTERACWTLAGREPIRYARDADYEAHFRQLFREAVRVRLRTDYPAIADLSGGLDSSSIVCVADDLLREGEADAPSLDTVSYVFDESKTADERDWIRHVEAHRGRRSQTISDRDHQFFALVEPGWPGRMPSWRLLSSDFDGALCDLFGRLGARVHLSGQGGDHMMLSSPRPGPGLQTLLSRGRLGRVHAELRAWSAMLRKPYTSILYEEIVRPHLPARLRRRLSRDPAVRLPPWVTKRCIDRLGARGLDDPHAATRPRDPNARATDAALHRFMIDMHNSGWHELAGVQTTFPFLHRPLVEFVAGIPFEQRLRPGETRSLQRRALKGVLPEATRVRQTKGNPSEVIYRSLARNLDVLRGLIRRARLCERGYVDQTALSAALERAAVGHERQSGALLAALRLEYWLQLEEARPRASANSLATARRGERAVAHAVGATHGSGSSDR